VRLGSADRQPLRAANAHAPVEGATALDELVHVTVHACGRVQGCEPTRQGHPLGKRETCHLALDSSESKKEVPHSIRAQAPLAAAGSEVIRQLTN
jgi:hypothetical protein